jgi:hypothetical protein
VVPDGLPIVLVMFVALLVVILFLNRPEVPRVEGAQEFIAGRKGRLGRLSAGERNTLIAFGLAIVLWTLTGLVGLFLGDDSKLYESLSDRWLDEGVVAVIAAGLLLVLPVDWGRRQFTLNWNQASRIDWGTILLFGAGHLRGQLRLHAAGVDPAQRHRRQLGHAPKSPAWSRPAPCSTSSGPSSAWSGSRSWPTWSARSSHPSRPASAGPAPPSAGAGPAAPAWP